MKIAIYIDDSGFGGVDCERPDLGNPGIGGTQYCFVLLMYFWRAQYPDDEVVVCHHGDNRLPVGGPEVKVFDVYDAIEKSASLGCELILYRFCDSERVYEKLELTGLSGVAWLHNFATSDALYRASCAPFLRRVVFVGRQQYDRYIDHPIMGKAAYVPNMYPTTSGSDVRSDVASLSAGVTYTGALVPSKGFHVLAREWRHILRAVPGAVLHVIGSGQLYDRKISLGRFGVAEKSYEERFMPHLVDGSGRLLRSVVFHGTLGAEKQEIYHATSVGVVNPTGRTEICPISVLEMASCCIPVVSTRKNGLPDVVLSGRTGYLTCTRFGFRARLIELLRDPVRNAQMGRNAREYILAKFGPGEIMRQWRCLFVDVLHGVKPLILWPDGEYGNNLKFVRMITAKLRQVRGFERVPPLIDLESAVHELIAKRR